MGAENLKIFTRRKGWRFLDENIFHGGKEKFSRTCYTSVFLILSISENYERKDAKAFDNSNKLYQPKLTFDGGGGGGWFCPPFFRTIFTAKTRHFQGCIRVWSRGHQVRWHPCKLGNLAIFYNAKNPQNLLFLLFLRMERG